MSYFLKWPFITEFGSSGKANVNRFDMNRKKDVQFFK